MTHSIDQLWGMVEKRNELTGQLAMVKEAIKDLVEELELNPFFVRAASGYHQMEVEARCKSGEFPALSEWKYPYSAFDEFCIRDTGEMGYYSVDLRFTDQKGDTYNWSIRVPTVHTKLDAFMAQEYDVLLREFQANRNARIKERLMAGDFDHSLAPVPVEKLPDYGALMSIVSFKGCIECGGFIDYDGYGNLATETAMSSVKVYPSTFKDVVLPPWATHVVWFNR